MISTPLPPNGLRVSLRAAFIGSRSIEWLAFARNNYNPLLVLYDTELEVRVFRKDRRPYSAIESVDFRQGAGTNLLIIAWRDSSRTFSANIWYLGDLPATEALRQVLQFFESKRVPLSSRAQRWLHGASPDQAAGTAIASAPYLATVSARLFANLVDLVVLWIASSLLVLLLTVGLSLLSNLAGHGVLEWTCFLVLCTIFEASRLMGTPGKRLLGLTVLDVQHNRVGLPRALARTLIKWMTAPPTLPQALLYRSRHPGPLWHDTLTGTRVVERWSVLGSDHVPRRDVPLPAK